MKTHIFQHVIFEDIGSMAPWLAARGWPVSKTHFFEPEPRLPKPEAVDLLIILGGPMSVHDELTHPWLRAEKQFIANHLRAGKYALGICLGAQLIAQVLGAEVRPNPQKEIGIYPIFWEPQAAAHSLLQGIKSPLDVLHWHGETFALPQEATHLAHSKACKNQAFIWQGRALGLQCHLETTAEGLAALAGACRDELIPGPFVQREEAILAQAPHLSHLPAALHRLLDNWLPPAD